MKTSSFFIFYEHFLVSHAELFITYRTFGINALSGPVPKEIGLLTNLKLL